MKLTLKQVLKHLFLFLILSVFYKNQSNAQLSLSVNIGRDTILPLKQSGPTSLVLSAKVLGNPLSILWTKLSGPGVTIQSPSSVVTSVTDLTPGNYVFQCLVANGLDIATDVINVRVVDYQKKNQIPCRTGAPVVWTLSATNSTDLYHPYLRRSGMDIRGGDTIKINRNPNNGGVYNRIYMGDFGGDEGCPVIVVPNGQIVQIGGANARWFVGVNTTSADTNFVNHVVFDGTYLRNRGIKYGFQSTGTGFGMGTRLITDLEIKGCVFQNNSLGIQIKIFSDSLYPWTVYDNFIMKNIKIQDNYFKNMVGSEGLYMGNTDPSGTTQAGNDGPVIRMDNLVISHNIFNGTTWDPIQTATARNVQIHDNIILNGSVINQSSQNWGILMGANSTGKIYNNIMYNGKGGSVGTLGYGPVEIYYNFIDSTMSGNSTSDGIYSDMRSGNIIETSIPGMWPPLQMNIHHNIVSRFERNAIFNADNENTSIPGTINNNYVVDPVRSLLQTIRSNAGDVITNNNIVRNFPVMIRDIGNPVVGPLIQVTQGAAVDTFSTAKDAIDWLFSRLSGPLPPNNPPTANAGNDQITTLPANSVTLSGSGTDSDGTITRYSWTKIAGPTQFNITSSGTAQTTVTNLAQGVYQFRFTVLDNAGASDADTVVVTVNSAANLPPTANAGSDVTLTLPANSTTLTGSASDSDGTIAGYAWSRVSGPTTFTLGTANAVTTTLSNLMQGTYVFSLTVTDNSGATATDNVTVTVNAAPNLPPTANAGSDVTLTLPANSTTLIGSGSDPDGTIASYAWSRVSGPTTFTLGTANAATTTLSNLVQGTYVLSLTVTDNSGATATDNVTVTVNAAPNLPPTANAGSDVTLTLPANSTTLNGSGSDPDGTIASYVWSRVSGPTTFTLGTANAVTTALSNLVQGTYVFSLTVTDNSGVTGTDNVTVTVNAAPNQAPTANAGSDVTLTLPVNSTTLIGSGSDPDGTIAGYAWSRVSGPTTFTLGTANAATTTLSNLVQGTYVFSLTVTDNSGATATDNVTVTVNAAPNQAPTANAGSDVTFTLPANSTTLIGSGSDPDGTIAGYAWSRVSGPTTFTLGTVNAATTTLSNLVQGTYVFSLTVTDNSGVTGTDNVTVTVNAAPNLSPTANAGSDVTLTLPANSTTLIGSGSDPDGTIASYAWSRVSGPTTFTLGTVNAATTTLSNLVQGTYVFSLTVTDNSGVTGTDNVTVTVNAAPNLSPTANAGSDVTLTLPVNSTTLIGSGTDPDGTIVSYAWSSVSGPTTFTLGTANAVTTTLSNLVQGTYVFSLTVIDNSGVTATDNVTVTVNAAPNLPPTANAGSDVALTLPANSTTLSGSGSDPDGTIASYAWSRVSGPTTFTLGTANAATTTLSNLVQGTYVFSLTVTDNSGVTGTDNVTVTVNAAPNQAPTANAGSDVTLTLPVNSTILIGSGSDPDGTIAGYAWSRVSGPTTFTLGTANAATTTLSNLVQGTYVFSLTITDNSGATGTDNVTVTVNAAPNQAPTANAGSDVALTLPANSTTLSGSGFDPDGTITSYAWSRVSGPTAFTLGTANAVTTTLSNLVQGTYVFSLTVTDNSGVTGTDNVTVTVNAAPNQAPTANAGSDVTLTLPANSTTLSGSGFDPDGTITSYVWSRVSGPTTFTLGTANAVTTTLSNLVQGTYVFSLTVTDNSGVTGTDNVTITINAAANQPPIANAGNNITLTLPANSATLTGSGSDLDGTIVSYAWSSVSGPATFTLSNANAATTGVNNLVQGTYIFRLTVTDNDGATATDDIILTVNAAPNQAPTANAGNNITLTLPTNSTTLTGTGTDADGIISSYAWSRVSGPTTFTLGSANAATTALNNLVQGTYVFRLTVNDNDGATATDDITVTVNPASNQAPIANAGNNITLTLPTNSTTLTGSGSDADGTIASYFWSKESGPTIFTLGTANAATTTLSNLIEGNYTFRITVTDNSGATDFDNVRVTVNKAPNQAPRANAGNNKKLTLPTNSTTLTGSGTDPDGMIVSYEWSSVSGPTTFTLGDTTAATTTLDNLVQGTYVFSLTVTDNDGATATDDVEVTIDTLLLANQAPIADAGNNVVLTLPTNSTSLTGSGTDADGTIASYAWSRVSGPTTFTFGSANAATTTLSNLVQGTYVFRLTVTDNGGASGTDDITVTVNPAPNQVPAANAGNNIILTLPTNSTTLTGSGTDADGTIASYTWSKVSGPTTFTFGSANAATTTLNNLVQGTYVFSLTVTDNDGATATDDIIVTVNAAPNQVPTANAGNNITLTLPTHSTTLTGSGTDADGTIVSYAWSSVSGPATFTLSNADATTATLTSLVQGTYVFRLTVTDNDGATAADDITVTVNPASNQAPIANAGNNITLTLPTNSTTLTGSGTDADGTIISYVWSRESGPTTFTLGSANAATTTLNNLVQGTYVFRLTITDNGGATATDNITVTVNAAVNQPPTTNAGADITMTLPTNSATLYGSGSDPDGTIVSYAWSRESGPTTFTLGSANAATTTLNNLVQGTYVFRLTITDNGGATATDSITVTVNAPVNQPPTANAGADLTMTLPTNSATLYGSGSDPDGTIVSYAWSQVSGPATFTLANVSAATTGLSNLVQGTYVFRLTITDNGGATATDSITITLNAAINQTPTTDAGSDVTLTLPVNSTTLIGSGSDPDGTIVSYAWSSVSGPTTFTLSNADAATTTLSNLVQGVYVFNLTVTDNGGSTATDDVMVTVNAGSPAPNQPPIANISPDQTIALPSNSATLHGNTSYDPDGTISSYSWQQISGPGISTFSSTTASIITVSNLQEGNYTYRLIVNDNGNAADTATVNITVLNNFRIYGPVALYPNPASDIINIVLNTDSAGTVRFNIYDMQGRKVMPATEIDKPRGFFTAMINVSQLRSDTYILEAITTKHTKMVFKFVKL